MKEIQLFLTELKLKGRMSDNTIRSYSLDLNKFEKFYEKKGLSRAADVTSLFLDEYIEELKKSGIADATLARNLVSIKAFLKYLFKAEIISYNLADDITSPKVSHGKLEILTRTQVLSLLEAPDDKSPIGQRDKAILYLLYGAGLRVSELINVKVSDLDMQIGSIEVKTPKQDRVVPFDKKTKSILTSYLNEGRRHLITGAFEELLFVNYKGTMMSRQGVWKMIKKYAHIAGIDGNFSPEIIRHSFAAHMIEKGADTEAVQYMLGQVSPYSMNRYTKGTKDYIRDVYDSTH